MRTFNYYKIQEEKWDSEILSLIAAIGDGGNVIYINRKYNIVVAVTGYFKPMIFDRVEFIEKNVVEALIK